MTDLEYKKSIRPVNVVRTRIPFGDMIVLYLQVADAALIIFGIPALICSNCGRLEPK